MTTLEEHSGRNVTFELRSLASDQPPSPCPKDRPRVVRGATTATPQFPGALLIRGQLTQSVVGTAQDLIVDDTFAHVAGEEL